MKLKSQAHRGRERLLVINGAMIEITSGSSISADPLVLPITALPPFPSEERRSINSALKDSAFTEDRIPLRIIPSPLSLCQLVPRHPSILTWPDETTRTGRRTQQTTVVVLDAARRPPCCNLTQHYSPAASPVALQFLIREGRSSTSTHDATSLA